MIAEKERAGDLSHRAERDRSRAQHCIFCFDIPAALGMQIENSLKIGYPFFLNGTKKIRLRNMNATETLRYLKCRGTAIL